jgi:two-component system cell cycle response regulator DivK
MPYLALAKISKRLLRMKPRALIVDDDEMLATFFTAAFVDSGYEVHTVHDGQEALAYLGTETPHAVLLDLQLPHVSGEQLLKFIKSNSRFEHTWVFATSVEGTRAGFLQELADFVLTKPVSYQQVVQLAARVQPA